MPALLRFGDQLVVNVGDVHHQRDLVATVDQVALDGVEDHRSDHVADVARFVNRRAAKINARLAGRDRLERLFGFRERVVNADRHK